MNFEDTSSAKSWDRYDAEDDGAAVEANEDIARIIPNSSLQSYAEKTQQDLMSDTASTTILDYASSPISSSRKGKAGWVFKLSSYLKRWRRRYAFIDNDYELHFATDERTDSHSWIDLRKVRSVRKVHYQSPVSKGFQWISSSIVSSWTAVSSAIGTVTDSNQAGNTDIHDNSGDIYRSDAKRLSPNGSTDADALDMDECPSDQYVIEIPCDSGELCLMYAEVPAENDEWVISIKNKVLNANIGFSLYQSASDNSIAAMVDILRIPGVNVNYTTDEGQTPLYVASSKGYVDIVKLLIDANADIDKSTRDGVTPLHIAAYKGQLEVIQILIDFSADLDAATCSKRFTALFCAVDSRRADIAKILIAAGADINMAVANNWTPLYVAVENNDVEMTLVILEGNPDLNAGISPHCTTPLHRAVLLGNKDIVFLLIEANADVNVVDTSDDITPLYLAADGGHLDIARALVAAGAEVDYFTRAQQRTPLLAAVYNNDLPMVNLLLAANADVRGTPAGSGSSGSVLSSANSLTALEAATSFGFLDVAVALRAAGAGTNSARGSFHRKSFDGGIIWKRLS